MILISGKGMTGGGVRKKTALMLRILGVTLLVLCLSGFGLNRTAATTTTIFAADGSDSTLLSRDKSSEFISEALKHKKASDKAGIVNFGANAAVELTPAEHPFFRSFQTSVKSAFTDIEQGLKLAYTLIPGSDRKRIVLVTDGLENTGDALKQARLLRQHNVTLDVFPLDNMQAAEVQVKDVTVPEALKLNEKFEVVVKVNSTVKTSARLKLYTDRQLTSEKEVSLQPGENTFAFSDIAKNGGLVTYSAVIEAQGDYNSKNNKAASFTYVEDQARILAIQDSDEGGAELVKMLRDDIKVDVMKPENVPVAIEELQKYDACIISNVSAEKLDDRFLDNLEVCIKNLGRGLLVTGGENSYAPGGYYKTVLETVLPVNMDVKPREEKPNLGLVLVIDKSGSMSEGQYGISKVELAKEAAIRSTEVLKSSDMIGVIAFDDAVQWVVKATKPDNLKAIQDAIGTIRADGGTQIINPLEEAYLSLKDADVKLKHIILLTDGQAERTGYDSLIEKINEAGITLSTVAVGESADARLLQALAAGGGGRFYLTDAFTDIPKIFVKETFLAGKTYLNNRTFTPSLGAYSDILKNITGVPVLDGYVATTAKSAARVVLRSDTEEPILATWQYGLGRTAAWTPDAKGVWTRDWLNWDQSPAFWKNTVSWLIQRNAAGGHTMKGSLEAGRGVLDITLPQAAGAAQGSGAAAQTVEAAVINPMKEGEGREQRIKLEAQSPGSYRGSFEADEAGVYVADVTVYEGGNTVDSFNGGVIIPYSPEYDITDKDTKSFLERLAYEGGGRVLADPSEVFGGKVQEVEGIIDMTPPLLVIVIILFMADIAVRRLNLPAGRLYGKLRAGLGAAGSSAARLYKSPACGRKPARRPSQASPAAQLAPEPAAPDTQQPRQQQPAARAPQAPAASAGEAPQAHADHIARLLEKKRKR